MGVDGYWIDAFASYPGTDEDCGEFIEMMHRVDPELIIAANYDKDYFVDDNGDRIMVDTDGLEDSDQTDYNIIKLSAMDPGPILQQVT